MSSAKDVVESEESDFVEAIDNTLKLRSREIEQPETDPSQRTHIGI